MTMSIYSLAFVVIPVNIYAVLLVVGHLYARRQIFPTYEFMTYAITMRAC